MIVKYIYVKIVIYFFNTKLMCRIDNSKFSTNVNISNELYYYSIFFNVN